MSIPSLKACSPKWTYKGTIWMSCSRISASGKPAVESVTILIMGSSSSYLDWAKDDPVGCAVALRANYRQTRQPSRSGVVHPHFDDIVARRQLQGQGYLVGIGDIFARHPAVGWPRRLPVVLGQHLPGRS